MVRILFLFVIFSNCALAQNIIGKKSDEQTLNYVNSLLWKHGQLLPFNLKDKSLESSEKYFYIDLIDSQKIDQNTLNIYGVAANFFHAKQYILIEKINLDSYQHYYLVFGETYDLDELKKMFVFFNKYSFNSSTKERCYRILINDSRNNDIRNGQRIYDADSLFNR